MTTLSTFNEAAEKRQLISEWMRTAIPHTQAQALGLIQISKLTCMRNWTCREALYDFAQQAAQARPTLVQIDPRRAALFAQPAKTTDSKNKPTRGK